MIALVSLAQAKIHLRRTDNDADADIQFKIEQASEIVMDYCKLTSVPAEWDLGTSPVTYAVPKMIQAATLLVVGELFMNRESSSVNVLSDAVKAIIPRTPTVA